MMPRSPGCPDRWRMAHTHAGLFTPSRPPVCPCVWSRSLIRDHFITLMGQARDLGPLEDLFA